MSLTNVQVEVLILKESINVLTIDVCLSWWCDFILKQLELVKRNILSERILSGKLIAQTKNIIFIKF